MIKKLFFIRQEDYWLYFVSFWAVFFTSAFLYIGVTSLRLLTGLFGFIGMYFMLYIIRKNYSKQLAAYHLLMCLVWSVLLAYGLYLLTK